MLLRHIAGKALLILELRPRLLLCRLPARSRRRVLIDRTEPLLTLLYQSLFLRLGQIPVGFNLFLHDRLVIVEGTRYRPLFVIVLIKVIRAARHDKMISTHEISSWLLVLVVARLILVGFVVVWFLPELVLGLLKVL